MTQTLVIVHHPDPYHEEQARQFVKSYHAHPPLVDHQTVVVVQGSAMLKPEMLQLFDTLPNVDIYHHDDSGWDIGAYLAVAPLIQTDMMICFGGSTFVRKQGWMKRMVEVFEKYGNGFYGPTASYQISPHLNTTGFWTSPKLLANCGRKVVTRAERYEFEHGSDSWWKTVQFKLGLPVKCVTWTDELNWDEWRDPSLRGIYHRDGQESILCVFRHALNYQLASRRQKAFYESIANTLTDRAFSLRKK